MCNELENMLKESSKENILNFLSFLKRKYTDLDEEKVEDFLENLNEGIFELVFYITEYHKSILGEKTNCFFIDSESNWLLICLYLLNLTKENFTSRVDNITNLVEDEWIDEEHISLSDSTINDIIRIAEDKYNLIKVLENSKSIYYFFNIPYVNKYAETHTVVFESEINRIFLHKLYSLEKNSFPLEYSFTYLLGLSLYDYVSDKKPKLISQFQKEFNLEEENISEKFAEAFGITLLRFTEYEDERFDQNTIEKYNRYFEKAISKLHCKREISANSLCPCGSGKNYKDCCKLRELKWIKEDGEIKKELKLHPVAADSLTNLIERYKEIIGRNPYGNEKIMNILSTKEAMNPYEYLFTLTSDENIDLGIQYATLKTEMLLSQFNKSQYTDLDIEEWKEALAEFEEKNAIKLKNNMSIFELVREANKTLKDLPTYIHNALIIINVFMNKITDLQFNYKNFKIEKKEDFCILCGNKIVKDGQILQNGIEEKSVEEVSNITRILFEDLMQTEVFLKNDNLFREKILSLSLLEKGEAQYKVNHDGKLSKHILVNKITGEQFNTKINMKEISSKSTNYTEFYDNIFDGLSSFIHLNITKIPRYFKVQNPLTEVEESRLVGLLGFFFINQSIFEIKSNLKLDKLLIRDMEYVYYQNSMFIKKCLDAIEPIENDNEIFSKISEIIDDCIIKINPNNTKSLL